MFRIARYHSIEVSLDRSGSGPTTPGRRRWVGALSPEALAHLTRVPENPAPETGVLLRWQLAYGPALFDAGFFELLRRAGVLSERVTLVVECAGPTSPHVSRGAPLRPGASAAPSPPDPRALLDDLALRLERAWEAEWLDVPAASRPAFVLVRPDGAVALGATLPEGLRPITGVLSRHRLFTAAEVRAVFEARSEVAPEASQVSHALARLRAQGLAHLAAASVAGKYRHTSSRKSEPFKVHVSAVTEAERRAWANWERAGVASLGPVPIPSSSEQLSDAERVTRRAMRWSELAERLRARGLRTVLPASRSGGAIGTG
ncbi:MAG: hypothetical protein ABS52_11090 [Gemmatimonadetes bacterium SCN 70-22]|nr:MAG: hypothetical protein ABS52_11090 [Gemmatimonadetes bacterium SCN 70-22]